MKMKTVVETKPDRLNTRLMYAVRADRGGKSVVVAGWYDSEAVAIKKAERLINKGAVNVRVVGRHFG